MFSLQRAVCVVTVVSMAVALSACDLMSFDNFEPPKLELEGAIVDGDTPIGVEHGIYGLELWEPGYELDDDIPVHIRQDGTFQAKLFEGEYKLVRREDAPWVTNLDTVRIRVDGSGVSVQEGNAEVLDGRLEVQVQPHFGIADVDFSLNGSTLTASFAVSKRVDDATLENVGLYVSESRLVDESGSGSDVVEVKDAGEIGNLDDVELEVDIQSLLEDQGTVYARVGVEAQQALDNLVYSQVESIEN